MNDYWQGFLTGSVPTGFAGLYVWWRWLYDIREKRRERALKEKAEAALASIRSRGDAPLFIPSSALFNTLYIRSKSGRPQTLHAGSPNLLYEMKREVDRSVPGGTLIYFVVQNNGQTVVGLRFLLDGQELDFDVEPEINGSAGRYYFTYPYDPQMHGRAQRLEVSFETASGIQNTHLYELVHGLRRLKRVDPA